MQKYVIAGLEYFSLNFFFQTFILVAQTSDRKKILNFRPFYSNEWAGVGVSNAER